MSYFAGNTSKFSQGGVDVNQLIGVGAAIESLNEAANLQAEHLIQTSALNAYQKQQDAISNFKLQAELGGIQDRADERSQTLDGVGNVVSGLGGLIKGFNQNKYGKEITGLQGFGTDQASLVPGIDKFVTLDGSPSPTTPVFGDAWLTGGRMV